LPAARSALQRTAEELRDHGGARDDLDDASGVLELQRQGCALVLRIVCWLWHAVAFKDAPMLACSKQLMSGTWRCEQRDTPHDTNDSKT
jgi:hypothetical protein